MKASWAISFFFMAMEFFIVYKGKLKADFNRCEEKTSPEVIDPSLKSFYLLGVISY
jgi:hypothetical protein